MLAPTDCSWGSSGPNCLCPRSGCRDAIRTGKSRERRCRTMRRPRNPVPPNTVTVRPFVVTITQIRQFMSELLTACGRGTIRALEQAINFARHPEVVLMKSFDLLGAQLLFLCWSACKHGCHTFGIDVEGQEYQRLVAWVSPLVHETVRFIDHGTWSPCFRLTVDRVRSGTRKNIVQSRS